MGNDCSCYNGSDDREETDIALAIKNAQDKKPVEHG